MVFWVKVGRERERMEAGAGGEKVAIKKKNSQKQEGNSFCENPSLGISIVCVSR